MHRVARLLVAALAIVALVTTAACGDDDDAPGDASTTDDDARTDDGTADDDGSDADDDGGSGDDDDDDASDDDPDDAGDDPDDDAGDDADGDDDAAPTTTSPVSSTQPPLPAEAVGADTIVDVVVEGGVVVSGGGRRSVPLGDRVAILVTSDVSDEIHLHGYDLFADVEEGQTGVLSFTAEIPGVFEVELEAEHLPLVELEIS